MSSPHLDPVTGTAESSIFFDNYEKEALVANIKYDVTKTRNALFFVAGILLLGDLLALSMANALNGTTMLYTLVVPAIFIGLAFLATQKPMLAMSIGAFLFVLLIALNVYTLGAKAIVSGLIAKAIIVYFFINGFSHARDSERARKKLVTFH